MRPRTRTPGGEIRGTLLFLSRLLRPDRLYHGISQTANNRYDQTLYVDDISLSEAMPVIGQKDQ